MPVFGVDEVHARDDAGSTPMKSKRTTAAIVSKSVYEQEGCANGFTPTVPPLDGWPTRIGDDLAWDGTQFRLDEQYTYLLSADEVEEVEAALSHFKGDQPHCVPNDDCAPCM